MTAIRVLHCITDLSPDGAQRTLLRLLSDCDPVKFESRVVCLKGGGSLEPLFHRAGIPVMQVGVERGVSMISGIMALRSMFRRWQPHVVQGWMYHGNLAGFFASRLSGSSVPVLWNVRRCLYDITRDRLGTQWAIRLGAQLSRYASRIIYCVELAAIQHEMLGFASQQRVVIPNGVDLARFKPLTGARAALRQELALSSDALVVGAVGRYHPQKDFEGLLRAAAVVLQRGIDAHLVIVGRGANSGNTSLKALASHLGITERVHLLGERQDVPLVVAGFDLFASSSINEGFCNVLVEAMACGVPCVATDAGAAREVLVGLGSVVPRGDAAALGGAIADTLSLAPHERSALGMRGRGCVRARYALQSMVDRYTGLYLEVSQRGRTRSRELVCREAA